MNKVLFSRQSDEWETPKDVFEGLNAEFHFTLDPCATEQTAKCEKYYTAEHDGLKYSWGGKGSFVILRIQRSDYGFRNVIRNP